MINQMVNLKTMLNYISMRFSAVDPLKKMFF